MKILASIGKAKLVQRSLASGHIFLIAEGKEFSLPKFYDKNGNSYVEYYCNFMKEDVQVYPLHKGKLGVLSRLRRLKLRPQKRALPYGNLPI